MSSNPNLSPCWTELPGLIAGGTPCVVVTIASTRGSVPGEPGGKAIITPSGLAHGNLGGGKVEARAIQHAQDLLTKPEANPELVTWNLQQDIGMTCGGEMAFLFEPIQAEEGWHIVLFGAGHVALALAPILATLPCRIDLIDTRQEWLSKLGGHPNLTTHLVGSYQEGVDLVTENSFVLTITKGHSTDRPVLREVLARFPEIPFLGVIGSASKRAVLLRELEEDGISKDLSAHITCPLGLPIGGNHPSEIAISIAAQLLEKREQRQAAPKNDQT